MSLRKLLSQIGVLVGRTETGGVDKYGDPTEVEAAGVPYRCRLDFTSGVEALGDQDRQTVLGDLWVEAAAAGRFDGTDRWIIEGVSYDVVGPPEPVRDRRRVRVVHAKVKATTGG